MSNPAFKLSLATRLLSEFLSKVPVGTSVTFSELSNAAGETVTSTSGSLRSAFTRIRRDHQIVFESVRGCGYKRLNDIEIVDSGENHAQRMRRSAERCVEVLSCVEWNSLPEQKKREHNAKMGIMSLVATFTRPDAMKRVEERAPEDRQEMTINNILRAYGVNS